VFINEEEINRIPGCWVSCSLAPRRGRKVFNIPQAPYIKLPTAHVRIKGSSAPLIIENHGHGPAQYRIRAWGSTGDPLEREPKNGDAPVALPLWLSAFPISDVVPAHGKVMVTISVNRTLASFGADQTAFRVCFPHVDFPCGNSPLPEGLLCFPG
jgi:hypothetical protein